MMEESQKIHTILNCFVDMNLELNEKFPYDIHVLSVSLSADAYAVEENAVLVVNVSISEPSANGVEEADLIFAHQTTAAGDMNTSSLPFHLKWLVGEQFKTVSIPVNRDFFEEGKETFLIGLTNLVNLLSGEHVQAEVLVVDKTVLHTVKIISSNINSTVAPHLDPNSIVFDQVTSTEGTLKETFFGENKSASKSLFVTLLEGENINVDVALDSPSEFGVEKVDVMLSNSSSNLVTLGHSRLEWGVGERYKTISIQTLNDNSLQGTRNMTLELRNPDSVKFDPLGISKIQIRLNDPPIARRFTTIDLGRIFKQRGSVLNGNPISGQDNEIALRTIADGQATGQPSLYWLTEIGTFYTDEQNTVSLSESVNYSEWPNYYFGINTNGQPHGVRLKVTNQGMADVVIGNNTYGVGENFYYTLARGATTFTLPTNDGLFPEGSVIMDGTDNVVLTAETFTLSKYKLEVEVLLPQFNIIGGEGTSGPHGFQLRTLSNLPNTYLIGDFSLSSYANSQSSTLNSYELYSKYHNMRTTYDGSTCTNSFVGANKIHDVTVKGLILLSQNSLASDYISHSMLNDHDFSPICGSSVGITQNLSWISIPFEIS